MKSLHIKIILLLTSLFSLGACDTDVNHEIPSVEAPVLVSSTPENNAAAVKFGAITIRLTYDKNVFFATANTDKITLNGLPVLSANVLGSSTILTITAKVDRSTSYTLSVPEGVVLGSNKVPAPAVALLFKTVDVNKTLVTSGASSQAQKVFDYLLENYEKKTLSCAMAQVNWNTQQAERVHTLTGKYPAMNCFDFVHLYASPANWIDYSNIAPVTDWWNAGGLVAAMWHWNVPVSDPSTGTPEYAFYSENNAFDAANATVEGTWENLVFTKDLAKIATHLKQLQAAGIPIVWRPFHEAAGGWFWWGKDATSFKKLWIAMFDYFKGEGINNLIWVWTSEAKDTDWYPGDAYVDIIGRDLYGKSAADATSEYLSLTEGYANKMIILSECGANADASMAKISELWTAGARWSYFMPWYDNDGATVQHADDAWWKDAMNQSYVITRETLPSMK